MPDLLLPPRHAYNRHLTLKWHQENGIQYGTPPVSRQAQLMPLQQMGLHLYGYNPSIFALKGNNGVATGEYIMSYRHHPNPGKPETVLTLAHLDKDFRVLKNHNNAFPGANQEDARFFWHKSAIWVSWAEAQFYPAPKHPTCVVKYGRVDMSKDPWYVVEVVQPKIGQNDGSTMEKNWVFFEHKKALRVFYGGDRVNNIDGTTYKTVTHPRWMYGQFKGGCAPVSHLGHLLRFVHSTLDNQQPPERRQYFVGAILYDEKTLEVAGYTKEPLLWGSDQDDLTPTQKASCPQWKAKVVFPCGAVPVENGFLLSVGVNDAACAIVKINAKDLKL